LLVTCVSTTSTSTSALLEPLTQISSRSIKQIACSAKKALTARMKV
jgi:hypothetical protein